MPGRHPRLRAETRHFGVQARTMKMASGLRLRLRLRSPFRLVSRGEKKPVLSLRLAHADRGELVEPQAQGER